MTDIPGLVISGVSGRMGQMLVETIGASDKARVVGALERSGHEWIGQDLGVAMGGAANGVVVSDDPWETCRTAQGVIDFTSPAATVALAEVAAQARAVHVIGTTGLTDEDIAKIDAAARHAVVVRAGNMSLGVNLMVKLTRMVSEALDADFDIEIVETHHRYKVDAPSGTAYLLGEAAAKGREIDLHSNSVRSRDGVTGARGDGICA